MKTGYYLIFNRILTAVFISAVIGQCGMAAVFYKLADYATLLIGVLVLVAATFLFLWLWARDGQDDGVPREQQIYMYMTSIAVGLVFGVMG